MIATATSGPTACGRRTAAIPAAAHSVSSDRVSDSAITT